MCIRDRNMVIGKILTIPEIFERGYEAVFIASGNACATP